MVYRVVTIRRRKVVMMRIVIVVAVMMIMRSIIGRASVCMLADANALS